MGTYSDSKIRKARTAKECACGRAINIGDEYLCFKYGLRNDSHYCLECGTKLTSNGKPHYDCAAVRERLGMELVGAVV